MKEHRAFVEQIGAEAVQLPAEQVHHILNVRRAMVGQTVTLFDGNGNTRRCEIVRTGRETLQLAPLQPPQAHAPMLPELTIAVSIPKGKRASYLLEKCQEIGVSRLIPLETRYTEERRIRQFEKNRLKWHRKLIEALLQVGTPYLMHLSEPLNLSGLAPVAESQTISLLFTIDPLAQPVMQVTGEVNSPQRVLAAIGPEGGFTQEEVRQAASLGIIPVRIPAYPLRTETAAVAAAAILAATFR